MNTETGEIFYTPEEIAAARERGEPLIEITEAQAQIARQIDIQAEKDAYWDATTKRPPDISPFASKQQAKTKNRRKMASRSRRINR